MPRQLDTPDVYFAYGSNMDRAQMRARCPDSKLVGWGYLNDHRLTYVGHSERWGGGVATVIPHEGDRVAGYLYFVTPTDLKRLDRYEGVPSIYRRKIVHISLGGQPGSTRAVTYHHVGDRSYRPPAPSYLSVIQNAHAAMLRRRRRP